MSIREDQAWLLQSRINPLPVSGALSLDGGRITFSLDQDAVKSPLDWLSEELGMGSLKEKIESGDPVVVFDFALDECAITWPITGGGAMMIVRTPAKKWVISYDYPTGGPMHGTLSMMSGRRKAKEWKRALAETGA